MNNVLILIVRGLKTISRWWVGQMNLYHQHSEEPRKWRVVYNAVEGRIDYRGLRGASPSRNRCSMDCMYSCRCHVSSPTELSANQSTQTETVREIPGRQTGWMGEEDEEEHLKKFLEYNLING